MDFDDKMRLLFAEMGVKNFDPVIVKTETEPEPEPELEVEHA